MARSIHRLNTLTVNRSTERGYYADGGGLYLQISASGTKSWIFRYTAGGKTHDHGLGPVSDFSLAEARERARECRQLRARGIDPLEARRAAAAEIRLEETKSMTFQECAERYMAAHEPGWKNEKHRDQWHATLESYAYPIIGALPVAAIDTALIMKVLEQEGEPGVTLWASRTETADRLRGRIERILDWAKTRGFRQGENPAQWKGHLKNLLAARKKLQSVKHHAALAFAELPAFMADLQGRPGSAARALELTILCALRTSEVICANRDEIDFAAKAWTVPAARMKAGKEHRVPLSERAIDILRDLPIDGDFLFPGQACGMPLSNNAMLKVLERMGRDDLTVHGFRSTFRDWAAERTNFSRDVCEMALAHTISDKVEAAYRRGELFEKRRRLMDAWAAFATSPAATAEVLNMRRA